jgi:hypothetical protein
MQLPLDSGTEAPRCKEKTALCRMAENRFGMNVVDRRYRLKKYRILTKKDVITSRIPSKNVLILSIFSISLRKQISLLF